MFSLFLLLFVTIYKTYVLTFFTLIQHTYDIIYITRLHNVTVNNYDHTKTPPLQTQTQQQTQQQQQTSQHHHQHPQHHQTVIERSHHDSTSNSSSTTKKHEDLSPNSLVIDDRNTSR